MKINWVSLPLRSRWLLGGKSFPLTSGSIETRPETKTGSNIDAADPQLRRDFQRLRANSAPGQGDPVGRGGLSGLQGGEAEDRRQALRDFKSQISNCKYET